jgi:hypothetical protein
MKRVMTKWGADDDKLGLRVTISGQSAGSMAARPARGGEIGSRYLRILRQAQDEGGDRTVDASRHFRILRPFDELRAQDEGMVIGVERSSFAEEDGFAAER